MKFDKDLTPKLEAMRAAAKKRLVPEAAAMQAVARSAQASAAIEGIHEPFETYWAAVCRQAIAREIRAIRKEQRKDNDDNA